MLGGRIRNGKPRVLVFCFVGVVMLLGIFVLRDTHIKLNDVRASFEHCEQQQESLSAQLQVVYEHKSRLEKSLQQEKVQHKKSKDDILAQYQELQDIKEKEKQEAGNRFNSVQQQHKMLQIQNEDLQEELNKVEQSNIKIMQDKQKLQDSLDKSYDLIKQKDLDNSELKAKILALQQEIEFLTKDLSDKDKRLKSLAMHVELCDAKLNALQMDKVSFKPGTAAVDAGKSEVMAAKEDISEQKVVKPDLVKPKEFAAKIEKTKNSVLKIGNFNRNKDLPNNDGVLLPRSADQEDKFDRKAEMSKQVKESNGKLLANKDVLNNQGHHNVHGGSDALAMGMGRRTGYLGNPRQQLELPNNIPPAEESLAASQQLAVPAIRNPNQKGYEHDDGKANIPVGQVENLRGNGLEQQENGDDQNLDNMAEEGAGVHVKDNQEEGKFGNLDFDQVDDDNDGDAVKKAEAKQEGVAVAPA